MLFYKNGLFKKAALFGDIHFGHHQDSEVHNQDCIEFIEWFCGNVKKHQCDVVIFLGDYHHNRVRTENRTGHYSEIGVEILDALNLPIYWLLGNHELYLRNSRDIHSMRHLSKYRNIQLIDQITQIEDVVFSPWLINDEEIDLESRSCRYIFGHFELPFFLMNQVIEKVYDGHGLHIDDFTKCEAVYSGHFHKRQVRLNKWGIPVHYIGNCFGHDMNDVNDTERGMAILSWGETIPQYLSWPDAPTFHRFQMSEFVNLIDKRQTPGPRSTIELIDDINLSTDIIDEVRAVVECRKLIMRRPQKDQITENITDVVSYSSLDEMIETKLKTMTYDSKFDPELLINLYKSV